MTTIYHELLPGSYLLLLAPEAADGPEQSTQSLAPALSYSLNCAYRSGKPAVWLDCGGVPDLPAEAVSILCGYHQKLEEQHVKLVLVHASEAVQQRLLRRSENLGLCFASTLADAAWQSGRTPTV